MNNNTDSKATSQLNQEMHLENCQISKMELSLGNSQRLKGMLRRNIEHILKKRIYEKLRFSEMN